MRISGDKNDSGYETGRWYLKSEVYLNGIKQEHVVTADDEEGFVLRELWSDGKPVIKDDSFVTVREEGTVSICLIKVVIARA